MPDATDLAAWIANTLKCTEKLKDEYNYHTWVREASRLLRMQRLLRLVEGTETRPTSGATEQEAWDDKSDRAFYFLMENCEEEPRHYIIGCDNAATAWSTLKTTYEERARSQLPYLLAALDIKFDDRKETINEHIRAFERRWLNLSSIVASEVPGATTIAACLVNFTKSDEVKAAKLLCTLPRVQPYINIVDITTKGDTFSFNSVVIRLKQLCSRKGIREEREYVPSAAFVTQEKAPCPYCKSLNFPGTSDGEAD